MKINVNFDHRNNQILAQARLKIPENTIKPAEFSFALARSMVVDSISLGEKALAYESSELELDLLAPLKKYTVDLDGEKEGELVINYQGSLEGSHSYFDQKTIHFSIYNAWYPVEFDADIDFEIRLNISNPWTLVRGSYDKRRALYLINFSDDDIKDANILLVNKNYYEIKENSLVKIYYQAYQKDYATRLWEDYTKIMSYYGSLYSRPQTGQENIVILPFNKAWPNSNYKRKNLTVLTPSMENIGLPKNRSSYLEIFAHELAHSYGTGADTSSWEDWLNETVAEWSALLYMKNVEKVDIGPFIEKHRNFVDGKDLTLNKLGIDRPEDVHSVGTLIFYKIYKAYGQGAIEDLLVSFDRLDEKTTDAYLSYLKTLGKEDLAEIIKEHIK